MTDARQPLDAMRHSNSLNPTDSAAHRDPLRRSLLRAGLAGIAGSAGLWAAGSAQASDAPAPAVVVVMLRGAVDGLSVVVPHADPEYRRVRAEIALAAPGTGDLALLPLDSRFGLHPSLERLMPWWTSGQLAFVHACGSPDPTRSHFDAQDFMETATPGRRSTPDGWLNRLLATRQSPDIRGMNLGTGMPRILSGVAPVGSIAPQGAGPSAGRPQGAVGAGAAGGAGAVGAVGAVGGAGAAGAVGAAGGAESGVARPLSTAGLSTQQALAQLHAADPDTAAAWKALQQSREALRASEQMTREQSMREMAESAKRSQEAAAGSAQAVPRTGTMAGMDPGISPGAIPLNGVVRDAQRLGQLLRTQTSLEVGFVSVGGWDTHVNQGGARGQLANRLRLLGDGLDALARGLGPRLQHTVILVMSEFGRTVRQNGTQGTDHGHGNVLWMLGGPVQGGRVHGQWPGLETSALHEGRDLAVTTDFRQVIAQVLTRHMKLDDAGLQRVLPQGVGRVAGIDLLRG